MNRRWLAGLIVIAAVVGSVHLGCSRAPEGSSPSEDLGVIAVFDGGVVTQDELDRAVLARPPEERIPDSEDPGAWYRTAIEDIVLEKRLLEDPELAPDDLETRLASVRDNERRRWTVEAYLSRHAPAIEPVTETDLREAYERDRERWVQSARRLVNNIFLRRGGRLVAGGDPAEKAQAIRDRFARGESFVALARECSDSETRHQGGVIGWVEPDQLAGPLAEVVFALEEGQISQPFETAQGVHLFLVSAIVEDRDIGFEEARQLIRGRLELERRESAIQDLADGLPEIPGTFIPQGKALQALVRSGDPQAEALRVGSFRLTVEQLRQIARQSVVPGADPAAVLDSIVETLARRERIFEAAKAEGLDADPKVLERLEAGLQRAEVELRRRMAIETELEADPEALRSWFQANRPRFSSPLELDIQRIVVPLDPRSAESTMSELERISRRPDAAADLDKVARALGGQVVSDGWVTLDQLTAIRPMAAKLAAQLEPGMVSAPYRTETTLEILAVAGRKEPEPQPLAAVYDQAREAFLEVKTNDLYGRWAESALDEANLEILSDRLPGASASSASER